MADQIIDKRTVAIPGPIGSVTPEVQQLHDETKQYRDAAEQFAGSTQVLQDQAVSLLLSDATPTPGQTFLTLSQRGCNIRDFGALGDGSSDDTTPFAMALDMIGSNGGGILYVPQGTYVTDQISLPSRTSIVGVGMPILKPTPTITSPAFVMAKNENQSEFGLRSVILDGSGVSKNLIGVQIKHRIGVGADSMDHFDVFEDLFIKNFTGHGFQYLSGTEVSVRSVKSYSNGGNGFDIHATDGKYLQCIAAGNKGHGFNVTSNQTLYVECKAFYNTRGFMVGVNGGTVNRQNVFSACEAQNNRNAGMYLTNTQMAVVSGCIIDSNNTATDNDAGELTLNSYNRAIQIDGTIWVDTTTSKSATLVKLNDMGNNVHIQVNVLGMFSDSNKTYYKGDPTNGGWNKITVNNSSY
jgi:hypothetical protein